MSSKAYIPDQDKDIAVPSPVGKEFPLPSVSVITCVPFGLYQAGLSALNTPCVP